MPKEMQEAPMPVFKNTKADCSALLVIVETHLGRVERGVSKTE